MRTRIVSYVPFGASVGPLPDALETQIVTPLGELSTAEVHYPRQGVKAAVLDGVVEVGFEYLNTAGAWVEAPNCRFLSMKGNFDHLESTPTRKYSFISVGWMLRGARVWEPAGLPVDADGKVQFLSANAGKIMATLIANAQARGWGAGLSLDFTATATSDGKPWAKIITLAYDLDIDLETVLANLYQQGVCDYRWEGRTLRIFNPDTAMGRDLTVGANPTRLIVADGQTSAPEEWTNEDLLSHLAVLGEEGARWEFSNATPGPLGRIEKVTAQGGVTDPGTASLLADPDLLKGSQTRISYTREFVVTEAMARAPFRDYVPGDWVQAQRGTGFERLRTMSLSLTVSASGVKGHAVLGDRLEDLLTKLAKRTKGISGGASVGGSGVRPAPEGPDKRLPAAPTGLVVDRSAYIDGDGAAQGQVSLSWAHSGKAVDGTVMGVDRFQVQYRINAVGELWKSLSSTTDMSVTYSPLPLFKADGVTPEQYAFRVRATGQNALASAWSSVFAVSMVSDTTPPPVPYFPAGSAVHSFRTAEVRWNGKGTTTGTNQVAMPRDFSHVNVYQGTAPNMAGAVMVGQIRDVSLWQSAELSLGTVWFALTAVDRSGNESVLSASQSILVTTNVDMSFYYDHMDASKIVIQNAGQMLIETGKTLAVKLGEQDQAQTTLASQVGTLKDVTLPGLTLDLSGAKDRLTTAEGQITTAFSAIDATTKYSTLPAPAATDGYRVGNTWRQVDGASNVIAEWRVSSNGNWTSQLVTSAMVSNLEVGKLIAGSAAIANVVAQQIAASTASFQTVDAKNLFVTGTASLGTAVAQRFAAETGTFIKLGVDQLTASTALINTGVIDKLWTDVVRSRQISTDMLRVGNGNLILDPGFAASPIRQMRLTLSSSAINTAFIVQADGIFYVRSNATAPTGAHYYIMLRTGDTTSGNMISVTGGDIFTFECEVWADAGVAWLPQVDSLTGTGAVSSYNMNATSINGTGGWVKYSFPFTVPAGVAEVYPRFRYNTGSSGFFRMRSPSFRQQVGTSLIVDGGVLAKHLTVTEEMWANIINFKKMAGDQIDANSLISDTSWIGTMRGGILINNAVKTSMLDADAITAKHTITGATIQTTSKSTGVRGIRINDNGIYAWDSTGLQTFSLSNTTGNVTAEGGTFTGAMFQSVNLPSRGVKLDSSGLRAWDTSGILTLDIRSDASGNVLTGTFRSGPTGGKSVVIFNRTTQGEPAVFLTSDGSGSGAEAAFLLNQDVTVVRSRSRNGTDMGVVSQGKFSVMNRGSSSSGMATLVVVPGPFEYDAGTVNINGTLGVSGAKNFVMPHPDKPGMELLHGSTESPVSGIEYWGADMITEDGTAIVVLPDYFESLAKMRGRTVYAAGNGAPVTWTDIVDGQVIVTGDPGTTFSWLVKAERFGGDFDTERWAPIIPAPPTTTEPETAPDLGDVETPIEGVLL